MIVQVLSYLYMELTKKKEFIELLDMCELTYFDCNRCRTSVYIYDKVYYYSRNRNYKKICNICFIELSKDKNDKYKIGIYKIKH